MFFCNQLSSLSIGKLDEIDWNLFSTFSVIFLSILWVTITWTRLHYFWHFRKLQPLCHTTIMLPCTMFPLLQHRQPLCFCQIQFCSCKSSEMRPCRYPQSQFSSLVLPAFEHIVLLLQDPKHHLDDNQTRSLKTQDADVLCRQKQILDKLKGTSRDAILVSLAQFDDCVPNRG